MTVRSLLRGVKKSSLRLLTHFRGDAEGLVLCSGKGVAKGLNFRLDITSGWEEGYRKGGYDEELLTRLGTIVRPGWTVWECGAFVGYYTCLFARWVGPTGKVFSFELNPHFKRRTEINLALNGLTNTQVHAMGIGNATGKIPVVLQANTNSHLMGTFVGLSTNKQESSNAMANVSTLDDLSERTDLPRPDLLKMDIDGAELMALPHMTKFAAKYRPLILLELHNPECDRAAWAFAQKTGYTIADILTGQSITTEAAVQGTLLMTPPE